MNPFTNHPSQTNNPVSYWKHGWNAIYWSFRLWLACCTGVIHGIYPPLFPFYASDEIIRAFKGLLESGRHDPEVEEILGELWLRHLYLKT